MTQQMFAYSPADGAEILSARLHSLLRQDPIDNANMLRRIGRLELRFRVYASSALQIWTPGVVITHEMRSTAELYLPFTELRAAICKLLRLSYTAAASIPFLLTASHTWPDFVTRLPFHLQAANPARLLRRLADDGNYRTAFIFALYQPRHYGGAFGRYPEQYDFLRKWLSANRNRFIDGINCLDAACGSGEGTWELLQFLLASDLPLGTIQVTGTTHEPIELFSAAHSFFPHDPQRAASFQTRIAPLRDHWQQLSFQQEDIAIPSADTNRYDVIFCNGILGGPFLRDYQTLLKVISGLSQRLHTGGILLAADHFHGGWKQLIPASEIKKIFEKAGLKSIDVIEGVGGQRRE